MKSPQVCYDSEKSVFTARSDTGSLDTFFVFPTQLKEGDKLPTLKYYIPQTKKAFCFDGQFNALTDNLEFLFDGPKGFSYKICLSIDPGSQQPYVWKTKKHGQTTGFNAEEDAVMYVPRYVCLEGSTAVETGREVLAHPTLYGATIMQTFCTMRLKIAVVEGNEWHKIGAMVHKEDYHLTYHKTVAGVIPTPDQELEKGKGGGDVVAMAPVNDEEKELTIDRKYKVIIITDSTGKTERKTSRTERLQMKQVRPVAGEVAFAPFDTDDRLSRRTVSSSEGTTQSEGGQMEKTDSSKTSSDSISSQLSSGSKAAGATSLPTSTSQPSSTTQAPEALQKLGTSAPTETSQPSGTSTSQPTGTSTSQPSGTSTSQPSGTSSSQPSGPEPKIVRISGSGTKSTERSSSVSTTATSTSRSSSSYSKVKKPAKLYSDDENEVFRFQYDELNVPCDTEKKKGRGLAKFFKWKPGGSEGRKIEHENQGEPLMLMDAGGSNYSIGDNSADQTKSKSKSLGRKEPAKPMVLMDAGSSYSTRHDGKDKTQASEVTGGTGTKKSKKVRKLTEVGGQKIPKPVVLMDAGSSYCKTDYKKGDRAIDIASGNKSTPVTKSPDVADDSAMAKPLVLMDAGSSYAMASQTKSKDMSGLHSKNEIVTQATTREVKTNKDLQVAKPMAMMEAGSAMDYTVPEQKTAQSAYKHETAYQGGTSTPSTLMDAGSSYSIGDKDNLQASASTYAASNQASAAKESAEISKPLVLLRECEGTVSTAKPTKARLATLASVEDKVSQTTSSEAATASQGKGPARPMVLMDAGSSYDIGDDKAQAKSMEGESIEENISEQMLMNAGSSYSSSVDSEN